MTLLFECDEDKADSNLRKHRVSFDEAQAVFLDELSITATDVKHSQREKRLRIVGMSYKGRLLVVKLHRKE